MELKEYQQKALEQVKRYLELLSQWRKKAEAIPEAEIDFPVKAWEKADISRAYHPRKNGIGEHLPNFCLKIPTGGGKTLLAVKTVDLINHVYLKKRTGLVLWVVPTTQIYRQTIKSLSDREHPYRQFLDLASGGRTQILEKTNRFTPLDVAENLIVMMLMLPSASRQNKETLKVFKDSGGFQDFFPAEDDVEGQKKRLDEIPNLDCYGSGSGFWGRQVKTSLGNTLRLLSPVIILDEGHKAYSETAQDTLRGFNPSIIVELSATPPDNSSQLVDISGIELNREDMIKLDLHIINKVSPDWKDTLLASVNHRNTLEEKAKEYEANTGVHIRPICLIQVERTGKNQRDGRLIHSEDAREWLIKTQGIPPEQVAVKTSEKDELKEVDDVGGLMSKDCQIRYIITKHALQEGWDCAFAYVLTILTNPSSRNAMTQLVGRILRQPFARKTNVKELDESTVFCFQQKAVDLLGCVRDGFKQEGLGDLTTHVVSDEGMEEQMAAKEKVYEIREQFKDAAAEIILPVFVLNENGTWRKVNYEMDIVSRIPWEDVELKSIFELTLPEHEEKDKEHVATLVEDKKELIRQREVIALKEGGLKVDSAFFARQLIDIVPNPWIAHELAERALKKLQKKNNKERVANNFVFIIEEMRKHLSNEKDRMAQNVFTKLLEEDKLRFLVIDKEGFRFPKIKRVSGASRRLRRRDGEEYLQKNLFEFVPEEEFNGDERKVAWYLDEQDKLFFWFRNLSRQDYAIQGWKKHRIYPDFIFTALNTRKKEGVGKIFVMETKGVHLKNEDTQYKELVFEICNKLSDKRRADELGLAVKEAPMRYEVVYSDEWQKKINELIS